MGYVQILADGGSSYEPNNTMDICGCRLLWRGPLWRVIKHALHDALVAATTNVVLLYCTLQTAAASAEYWLQRTQLGP